MDISRRSFIKGAGLAGTAALGAAALAGCASTSSTQSADAAGSSEAGRWSWSTAPEPIPDDKISDTYECELCIVGAGVAGNPAALYAAKHGYDVIVLQKESTPQVNGQGCGSWNTKFGTENGLVWNISNDIQNFAAISNGKPNLRLVRNIMERSGAAIEWIVSEVPDPAPSWDIVEDTHTGCQWILNDDYATRYTGFKTLHNNIAAKAAEYGARYLYETPAVQLVTDGENNVVGVIGQTGSSYVRVNASKGVILCTGDISDDEEMLEAYCPVMLDVPTNHAVATNTGDGLKMGLWVGADMDDPPSGMQMFITPSALPQGTAPCVSLPYLHVNTEGKRFFNENGGDQYQGTSIALQPDHRAYQIMDSHVVEHGSCTQEELDEGLKLGNTYQSDTIEGLADAVGIPADELVRTVKRYNELVDGGDDLDFGVDPEVLANNGIKDAPFYLMEYQASKFVAAPGLTCNEYLQVLSKDRQVIKGLYAAGNVQGSFFGYDYPVNGFGGFSLGRSMTGGVLAVMSVTGTFDDEIA